MTVLYASPGNQKTLTADTEELLLKQIKVLNDSGVYYWRQKEHNKALKTFSEALRISENINDKKNIASSLNNIGLVYYSQGDYTKCLDYYNRSIEILKQTGDSIKIAQSLLNTGIVYKSQGIYDKAATLLFEAAKYFEDNNRYQELASCYNTIANTQSDLGYYAEALKYHFKALEIRKKIGNDSGIAGSLNNIGITYKKLDSLNLALDYFNQSLVIKNGLGDKMMISTTLTNIGDIMFLTHNYKNAEIKYLESYRIKNEIKDQNGIIFAANKLGELYLQTGFLKNAGIFLEQGFQIAQKINSKELALNNLKLQSQLYERQNQLDMAIETYKKYDLLKNQIFDNEKTKALTELRIKYEADKNEQEIETLNEIKEIQTKSLKAKTIMLFALSFGLIMFILFTIIAYRAYKQKQKSNNQIKTLMHERQHRAKNNLQIISELLGLQSGSLVDETAKGAIRSGESRMQAVSLIDKMLYQNAENTEINIRAYIKDLVNNLVFLYDQGKNKVKTIFNIEEFTLDANKATPLGLILNELVTNSLKYAFEGHQNPEINIELRKKDNQNISLFFRDNGQGIPENFNLEKSKSLGLKLVYSLSKQLKGSIKVENQNGLNCYLDFKA